MTDPPRSYGILCRSYGRLERPPHNLPHEDELLYDDGRDAAALAPYGAYSAELSGHALGLQSRAAGGRFVPAYVLTSARLPISGPAQVWFSILLMSARMYFGVVRPTFQVLCPMLANLGCLIIFLLLGDRNGVHYFAFSKMAGQFLAGMEPSL